MEGSWRKGINPLIAVVLLVAFTISVALLTGPFFGNILQKSQGDAEEDLKQITKASNAQIEVIRAEWGGDSVDVTIRNNGREDLEDFVVTVNGDEPVQKELSGNLKAGEVVVTTVKGIDSSPENVRVDSTKLPVSMETEITTVDNIESLNWEIQKDFEEVWVFGDLERPDINSLNGWGDRIGVGSGAAIRFYDSGLTENELVRLPVSTSRDLSSFEEGVAVAHGWDADGLVSVVGIVDGDWGRIWTTNLSGQGVHRVTVDREDKDIYVGAGGAAYYNEDGDPGVYRLDLESGGIDADWKFTGFEGQVRAVDYDGETGDVFMGTNESQVFRIDTDTEDSHVWNISVDGQIGEVKTGETGVYAGYGGHWDTENEAEMIRLNRTDGSLTQADDETDWNFTQHNEMIRGIYIGKNHVYAGTGAWDGEQTVEKIEKVSADQVWNNSDWESNIAGVHKYNDSVYSAEAWGDNNITEINDTDGGKLQEVDLGTLEGTDSGHNDRVTSVAVDTESYVYSSSADETVRKISPDGEEVWNFTSHNNGVTDIAIEEDIYVYSGSRDGSVKKINASSGNEVWSSVFDDTVQSVAFSGSYVYSSTYDTYSDESSLRKINASNGDEIWNVTGNNYNIRDIAVDSNGYVYIGLYSEGGVGKINASNGDEIWNFTGNSDDDTVWDVAVDSDGYVYSGWSNDGAVRKISPDGEEVWNFTGHEGSVRSIVVSDSGYVYSGSTDDSLRKINSSNAEEVWSFKGHAASVHGVAFDDGYVYSGSVDNTVRKLEDLS